MLKGYIGQKLDNGEVRMSPGYVVVAAHDNGSISFLDPTDNSILLYLNADSGFKLLERLLEKYRSVFDFDPEAKCKENLDNLQKDLEKYTKLIALYEELLALEGRGDDSIE